MKALIYTGHPAWKESLNPIIKSRWEQHINEIPEIESFRLYSIYNQSQKDIESQLKDEEILIGFNIDNYLDESFFERHPNLKYISTLAMGYGNFDRDAAKKTQCNSYKHSLWCTDNCPVYNGTASRYMP